MGTLWFEFHDPQQSLITEYARDYYPAFDPTAHDFVIGGFLAGLGLYLYTLLLRPWNRLLLLAVGAFGTGRGPGAYLEFQQKVSGLLGQPGLNKVGLSALAGDLVYRATTREVIDPKGRSVKLFKPAPVTVAAVRVVQGLLVLIGLAAFWRALPRTTDAEAAMLALLLLPLLTSPANYYYSFVIAAAMLARRRPWAGVVLSLTVLAWIAAAQIWFLDDLRYRVYDVFAVAFSLAILVGAALSQPLSLDEDEAPTTA